MRLIKIFTLIGSLFVESPYCLSSVPLDAPPGVRIRAATTIINPGAAELGDAINTTRQLMWSAGVHEDSVYNEVKAIIGYKNRLEIEKTALERRTVAAPLTTELRDAREVSVRLRAQLAELTIERNDLNAARLAIQGRLDAAILERNALRDENIRITAQLAALRREREDIERNLVRITEEREEDRRNLQEERVRYIALDAEHKKLQRKIIGLQEERLQLIREKTQQADQLAALQNQIDGYKAEIRRLTAEVNELNDLIHNIREGQPRLIKAFASPYETLTKIVAPLISPAVGYALKSPKDFSKAFNDLNRIAGDSSVLQHGQAKEVLATLHKQFGILPTTGITEAMGILIQMAEAQLAIDPTSIKEVKAMAFELNDLRSHPYIAVEPGESLRQALDRAYAQAEQTRRVKKAMMGAGFLAIEKPFETLDIIGQIISADGTYGITGGENQIPTRNITEIVAAIDILSTKREPKSLALLSAIAAGMGVETDQLPRVVRALRPLAILTENLKGSGSGATGKRNVFNELKGISVRRIETGSFTRTPPLSPAIHSPTNPGSVDAMVAFAESIRREVENQRTMGKIMGADMLATWLKNDFGLSSHPRRMVE
ncbi:MAG: hypothetical protein K2Q34_02620 [Alphaproteobacteria bacterium]|nr:hypothetical protein [Alphaproteobacteria bacterium]